MHFHNREEAGKLLGKKLKEQGFDSHYRILGLPRGGVPVAFEVAKALQAPLDVFIVRKLGVPGHEELAMGAIGPEDTVVLNDDLVASLHIAQSDIDASIAEQRRELARRLDVYRRGEPPLSLTDQDVIIVDDGLATGASMRAACRAVQQLNVQSLTVAIPVGAPDSCKGLRDEVDQLIVLSEPWGFAGVGQWYDDFRQVGDQEVIEIMGRRQQFGLGPLAS
jgi:predicted phosphoribosyltransferase